MRDEDRLTGVLLGTGIGDAIGLPFEGLSPARVEARLQRLPGGALRHSLVLGRGMVSDDTEHACMVARALLGARKAAEAVGEVGAVDRFRRRFAGQLRRWLLTLPPAVGFGTLRACLRLLLGLGIRRSGVASAGNGPAMRAALLGVWARDEDELRALVRASTRLTHTDPRAEDGALLVARWAADPTSVRELSGVRDPILCARVRAAITCAEAGASIPAAREALGCPTGVSGFVVDTLAAVCFCWQRHRGQPREAIAAAVRLGGDTDTVAAIVGALLGAELGAAELERRLAADPGSRDWLAGLHDWPISVAYLRRLGAALAHGGPAPRYPWLGAAARNLALLVVVLAHGFARLIR